MVHQFQILVQLAHYALAVINITLLIIYVKNVIIVTIITLPLVNVFLAQLVHLMTQQANFVSLYLVVLINIIV